MPIYEGFVRQIPAFPDEGCGCGADRGLIGVVWILISIIFWITHISLIALGGNADFIRSLTLTELYYFWSRRLRLHRSLCDYGS
jgi:hypothetical protein